MGMTMSEHNFADIYSHHKENVWQIVARFADKQEDREDIFQEVFLAIHRNLPRFRGEAAIGTWLYRIAVNTAINHQKKLNRQKLLFKFLAGLRLSEASEPSHLAELALFKPLDKLNPRQKMIVILADVEERPLEEIASWLNLPIGTVKSNLSRAREIIKKELKKHG